MHTSIFVGILLSLTTAWPNLPGDSRIFTSSTSSSLVISLVSASLSQEMTTQAAIASHESMSRTTTASALPSPQTTVPPIQSTDVMIKTRITTVTQTSFLPVSTLVTQAGSIIYYSTWLTVIHSTTVLTLTEYVTGAIKPLTETITETISLSCPPLVTIECVSPLPITETVYLVATTGSVMAITLATMVLPESISSIQPILTASMSMTVAKTSKFWTPSTAPSSTTTDLVSHLAQSHSSVSSAQIPNSIFLGASEHDNSIPTGSSKGAATISLVSEVSNGQLIIPPARQQQ